MQYEDNKAFNEYLDEEGPVKIIEAIFSPSKILFVLDQDTYEEYLRGWREQNISDFKELVYSAFPTPISYHFHRYHNRATSDSQRLGILKDVWEAVALTLHAIVVGEFHWLNASLTATKITPAHLRSDKIWDKLWVIDKFVSFAQANNMGPDDLACLRIVQPGVTDMLRELNHERNTFWHSETPSDDEARPLVDQFYPKVVELLQSIQAIQDFKLIRFAQQTGGIVKCEVFSGFNLATSNHEYSLSPEQLVQWAPYCNPGSILLEVQGTIFTLAPFIHYARDEPGHSTKLCLYKKREGIQLPTRPNVQWVFQLVGQTLPITLGDPEIKPHFDTLDALL